MAAHDTTDTVPTGNVTTYRLHAHHLTNRQPADHLHYVAAACAIQNSPPGSALLALGARTQMRDRNTIVDKKHHHHVWKTTGTPGTLLADGTITGTWRPRKNGRKLTLTITPLHTLTKTHRNQLHDEADHVAALRGASEPHIEYNDEP